MTGNERLRQAKEGSEDVRRLEENATFLEENYPSKSVAVKDSKLVAVGDELSEVLEAASHQGIESPLVASVRRRELHGVYLIR